MPAELNGKTASGVGAKSEKKSTVSACLAVMDVGALCGLEVPDDQKSADRSHHLHPTPVGAGPCMAGCRRGFTLAR